MWTSGPGLRLARLLCGIRSVQEPPASAACARVGPVAPASFLAISRTMVAAIIRDGVLVDEASEGDEIEILLRETPFFAERGGQIGDAGFINHLVGHGRLLGFR